jgi:succinoglycan biosynthesis transport protein ExoP
MDKLVSNTGLGGLDQELGINSISSRELIDQLIGVIRRQYPIIVLISACAIALSLVYLFTTPKQYTAHALLLIDTTKMRVVQPQQQLVGDLPLDDAQVNTQIELLKSDEIGLSVIKNLQLTGNPEFVGSQTGLLGAIFGLISRPFFSEVNSLHAPASENALTQSALSRFQARREIKRVTETYVLNISFTSLSAGSAAAIANGIADAYIVDQLDSKFQSSRRAGKWLQERIGELRQQAMTADRAVLEFKEQKNIIDMGGRGGGGDGRLLSDQQVVDLNSQLATARATTAEAKARLDRIQVVMAQEIPDAAVTDSLNSSIISQLRAQYLDFDRRRALYAARYGLTHLAVVNLQTQMTQLRRSMSDELSRIAESYKSNYAIAMAREASLEKSLTRQISGAQLTNRDRLGLDELESRAKVYHSIHDSFLQRYMEITQQQSLPITEARVISAAAPPGGASSPQTFRVLTLAGALGLMLSFAIAWLRESTDRVFRTAQQVEQILKTNCLAVIPIVKNIIASAPASRRTSNSAAKSIASEEGIYLNAPGLYRYVIHDPLSSFAEGFRAVKVAADISGSIKQNKVIGITSTVPHEGKSTVACNFAELIARGGSKTILIDCDLRNPTLTRRLISKGADIGLLQVIGGKAELHQAIRIDDVTGLAFLPAVVKSRLTQSSEILASEVFRQLIERLRNTYDYIIIDFPPLTPVVDVRATTNIIDSYVFVIEWGRTRFKLVERQLASAPEIFDRLLGVVLNKANVKVLERYESYYGRPYYEKNYYARYGYTK